MAKVPTPQELTQISYQPPAKGWMDVKPEFRPGTFVNAAQPKWLEMINYPYPRKWSVADPDWQLPPDWKEIILQQMEDRLSRFRSLKLFFDICRQVPLLSRHRRPQEHAGFAGGTPALGL